MSTRQTTVRAAAWLLLASTASAQPEAPALSITSPAPGEWRLDWAPVAGACRYAVRRSVAGGSWIPLAEPLHPGLDLSPWTGEGAPAIQLFQVVASGGCEPPSGAAAHWPLDGDGLDASGHGLHLTPAGAAWTAGRFGGAAALDGDSARLEIVQPAAFEPGSGGWTASVWARIDGPANGTALGFYRCGADPSCGADDGCLWRIDFVDGAPRWIVRDDEMQPELLQAGAALSAGAWHHLAGTIGEDRRAKLWVDGQLAVEGFETFAALSAGPLGTPFSLGRVFRTGWAEPTGYLAGELDEVRLYARELSPAEIAALAAQVE